MFTVVIIAMIVIGLATLLYLGRGRARGSGGRGLKRRFGPEYDRALARHDGDVRAAELELDERVRQHGSLRELPLSPEAREHYMTEWAAVQEQFMESPQKAVTEADALLARLAKDRGFPDSERFEEQVAALSVHHAYFVQGYRSVPRRPGPRALAADRTSREGKKHVRALGVPPSATAGLLLSSCGPQGLQWFDGAGCGGTSTGSTRGEAAASSTWADRPIR
ncbi:hypothetical protein [Streptomyces phaeochromogenes]|uniref:hypothetical protein n=1 Tax=Streptomyces phaeochromogenes TaxID=1923 RepID=UPI0037174F47